MRAALKLRHLAPIAARVLAKFDFNNNSGVHRSGQVVGRERRLIKAKAMLFQAFGLPRSSPVPRHPAQRAPLKKHNLVLPAKQFGVVSMVYTATFDFGVISKEKFVISLISSLVKLRRNSTHERQA